MRQSIFTKDLADSRMLITREFDGTIKNVWQAWTDPTLLEQWWAPKPFQAKTKKMDFRTGGQWLYYMLGPDGSQLWCKTEYQTVVPQISFEGRGCFCDENGNPNNEFPRMNWNVAFSQVATGTKVDIVITYDSVADMEKILELGFKEGFTMAHGNLDELLESKNIPA